MAIREPGKGRSLRPGPDAVMTSLSEVGLMPDATDPTIAKFPNRPYRDASSYMDDYHDALDRAASTIDGVAIERAARLLLDAHTRGAVVFSCGNGGSASIANHLQCDHLKGVATGTDLSPRVVSLASNVELITAITNDCGYEDVFGYQLRAHARAGDVLLA